jgi:hypothetical protein
MASLDFIENSSKGYGFFWKNRRYIFQNAIPVIFVKVLFALISIVIGAHVNPLREGIILFPAYVVEAFFLVNLARFYIYGEAIYIWGKPIPLPKQAEKRHKLPLPPISRNFSIKAGVAVYLLIKLCSCLILGLMAIEAPEEYKAIGEPSLLKAMLFLMMISGAIWCLRLCWLYVPISLGFSISAFMKKISGIENSFYFIGVFFICSVSIWFIFILTLSIAAALFLQGSAVFIIISKILECILIISILSIQTIAISAGTYDIMTNTEKNEDKRY